MDFVISENITLYLRNRTIAVTINALEMPDFVERLFAEKGHDAPAKDDGGNPIIGENGEPKAERYLTADIIESDFGLWLKTQCPNIELRQSEIRAVFNSRHEIMAKKNSNWEEPGGESQTSQPFTDPRFAP